MDEILNLLTYYGLTLEEANEDWAEKVKNFQAIEKTLTPEQRQAKIDSLIKSFDDYHDIQIEEEQEEKKIEEEVKKPKKAPKKKKEKKVIEVQDDLEINTTTDPSRAKRKLEARKKGSGLNLLNWFD